MMKLERQTLRGTNAIVKVVYVKFLHYVIKVFPAFRVQLFTT